MNLSEEKRGSIRHPPRNAPLPWTIRKKETGIKKKIKRLLPSISDYFNFARVLSSLAERKRADDLSTGRRYSLSRPLYSYRTPRFSLPPAPNRLRSPSAFHPFREGRKISPQSEEIHLQLPLEFYTILVPFCLNNSATYVHSAFWNPLGVPSCRFLLQ